MVEQTWTHLATVLIVVVAGSGAIAGWDKGWAYAEKGLGKTGGPGAVRMEIELGWWNATSSTTIPFAPVQIVVESKACRGMGTVAAVALLAGALFALYQAILGIASALEIQLSSSYILPDHKSLQVSGLCALAVLTTSVALYLALLIGTHKKFKEQPGDKGGDVWPRPDWAFMCAMLSGGALASLASSFKRACHGSTSHGYMPI
uniref:Uncharacterized protein n=1 Tax=Chlamydomonas leiostraca TaxID=1034604 RepID=A0A7S0RRK9_9CHLO|mmetsp:Transcript_2984/g.7356  ORF Transcript_2984/g.7356 Transcript_2984/m.7356 type:complete len:204 (+) Transcript_2984:67-678(+)